MARRRQARIPTTPLDSNQSEPGSGTGADELGDAT